MVDRPSRNAEVRVTGLADQMRRSGAVSFKRNFQRNDHYSLPRLPRESKGAHIEGSQRRSLVRAADLLEPMAWLILKLRASTEHHLS